MILEVAALASAKPNRLHVMPWDNNKWRVKKTRSKRAMGIYATEAEAMSIAEKEIFSGRVEYGVVHDKQGRILKEIKP